MCETFLTLLTIQKFPFYFRRFKGLGTDKVYREKTLLVLIDVLISPKQKTGAVEKLFLQSFDSLAIVAKVWPVLLLPVPFHEQ
jgi:hypothetical protein